MPATVSVSTPSRLHFGMFSFGRSDVRSFGGVGVMIERPGVELRIRPADRFAASGPLSHRIAALVERLADSWSLHAPPACRIEVLDSPPEHVGLGCGTQLELAVTAGLRAFLGGEPLDAAELAALSGRGRRSAIGTYGFLHGGLLVESGKQAGQRLAPLECRVELPAAWRFQLIRLPGEQGLAGDAERRVFGALPPVPLETTEQLRREVDDQLLPAAQAGDFERFSQSLYRFGHLAGTCFAKGQGGPFASPRIAELVARLRAAGVAGVGQSSWGPTVFALHESEGAARNFARLVSEEIAPHAHQCLARAAARGAVVQRGTTP